MVDANVSSSCLGFPIDHRLKRLFSTNLITSKPYVGDHGRVIENYGRRLQQRQGVAISNNEIEFAKWLAMPQTQGGVVIALLQPSQHQRYYTDHHQTVNDCDTLYAVDEVCKTITGSGLGKISCFDAFPFRKNLVTNNVAENEKELDEAYAIFLEMIQEKQPDVVFCCYHSPHPTKYKDFQCFAVGRTRDYKVRVNGQSYACVNGFHPSYALNYLEDKSALRSLFILEAAHAFHKAAGIWSESSWVIEARENCAAIVQDDINDKKNHPDWTKHDFQRERFHSYMSILSNVLGNLKSGTYDAMTDDELYIYMMEDRYNVLLSNCLLLLVKIIDFERKGHNLEERGFAFLRHREERDVRDLRRNVEKRCEDFLYSLRVDNASIQTERGSSGVLTPDGLSKTLLPYAPTNSHSRFNWEFRLCFISLLRDMNNAFTCRGKDIYEVSRDDLARAFKTAATRYEEALTQQIAVRDRRAPGKELDILNSFTSLQISNSPPRGNQASPSAFQYSNTSKTTTSYSYQPSQSGTPARYQPQYTAPTPQKAPAWSPPQATPRFGVTSQLSSPQIASSSRTLRTPTCTKCKQTGHYSPSCPTTECYRCKGFGHMSFDCPTNPSPARKYKQ